MLQRLLAVLIDACTAVGVLIATTGGVRFKSRPAHSDFNLMYFGPLLLPLAICLVLDVRPAGSRVLPLLDRWALRINAWPEQFRARLVWLSIVGISLGHALVVFLRHMSFQTGMDLAIYANACRGALYSTMKGDVWLFADHFEPALLAFTPLCRSLSPAGTLLAAQVIAFGLGAFGIYKLSRQRQWSPAQAWLASLLYLTFSPNVRMVYYDFHLIVLALGLTPWLWWALASQRQRWFIALALVSLGLKESVPLTLFGVGAYLCVRTVQRKKLLGAALMLGTALLFVAIMKVVYPWFRHGEETMYFAKYYGHLGKNLNEFLVTLVTRPGYFIGTLIVPSKIAYVSALVLPFLFFPLARPVYLLPIALPILVNILSNDKNILSQGYHYEAEIEPMLFAMAIMAFNAPRLRNLWLAVLLVCFTHQSILGLARWSVPNASQRALAAELKRYVPNGRALAAPQRIAAHLTDHEKLYMFDYWQMEEDWKRAELVVIGFHGDWLGWYSWKTLNRKVLPRMLPQLQQVHRSPAPTLLRIFEVRTPSGPQEASHEDVVAPGAHSQEPPTVRSKS